MVLEDIELNLLMHVSYEFAKQNSVLPVRRYKNGIIVFCADIKEEVINNLKSIFNENIVPYIKSIDIIEENIEYYYDIFNKKKNKDEDYSEDIYEDIFSSAILYKASDIHLEPQLDYVNIRFRINGDLKVFKKISKSHYSFISSKLKVMASIYKPSTKGSMSYRSNGKKYIIKVSLINTSKGEKISLKIYYNEMVYESIEDLGFSEEQFSLLDKHLRKKSGMILIAGSSRSGKSTTFYKFIEHLNNEKVSIYTIEDEIEYEIEGITQIHTRFSKDIALDCDILAVGEIKESEMAKLCVSSSVASHKVFSTINALDSLSVINRLMDLGVDPSLTINALDLVISQRLIKKLCRCKKKESIDERVIFKTTYPKGRYYSPKGCEKCKFTGYSGRILLNEILVIDDIIKDMLLEKKTINEINTYIRQNCFEYSFEKNIKELIDSGEVYILDLEVL